MHRVRAVTGRRLDHDVAIVDDIGIVAARADQGGRAIAADQEIIVAVCSDGVTRHIVNDVAVALMHANRTRVAPQHDQAAIIDRGDGLQIRQGHLSAAGKFHQRRRVGAVDGKVAAIVALQVQYGLPVDDARAGGKVGYVGACVNEHGVGSTGAGERNRCCSVADLVGDVTQAVAVQRVVACA